ncbi:hypothetical protein BD309DRAFT_930467 [Dichomitus squalens]|nr:hypothetical protein BD309DRAFT_930467 [Dichomitus squalens]
MTDSVETLVPREASSQQPLIIQIVVRPDLLEVGWGVEPLMAQVAHATGTSPWYVLHETRERTETQAYLDNLKNMGKVVRSLSLFDLLRTYQLHKL